MKMTHNMLQLRNNFKGLMRSPTKNRMRNLPRKRSGNFVALCFNPVILVCAFTNTTKGLIIGAFSCDTAHHTGCDIATMRWHNFIKVSFQLFVTGNFPTARLR